MVIRRYNRGEESAVWKVYFAATHESNARDYHADLIDRWAPLDPDTGQWADRLAQKNPFVAVVDEEIVGMAEIEPDGFIDYFYVHPRWQDRGIGKALLATLESEAAKLGVSVISADVSITAKALFLVEGFPHHRGQIKYHSWASRSEFQNAKDTEQRTRRCSEPGPADSLRDEFNVRGGWLRSLTFTLGSSYAQSQFRGINYSLGSIDCAALPWWDLSLSQTQLASGLDRQNNIRGRLLFVEIAHSKDGERTGLVFLELQNLSWSQTACLYYDALRAPPRGELRDSAGKIVEQAPSGRDAAPEPCWLTLPAHSTMRFLTGYGPAFAPAGHSLTFGVGMVQTWVLPVRGTNGYLLSGTFTGTVPKGEAHDHSWRGTVDATRSQDSGPDYMTLPNKITGANAGGPIRCRFGRAGPPASLSSVVGRNLCACHVSKPYC